MGDRLYGCDECLDACPPGLRLVEASTRERGSVDLEWALTAADEALLAAFPHFYLPQRSPRYLRRNVLVAMGNEAAAPYLPLLALHAGHPDWLLRLHAVWALARLDDQSIRGVLEHRMRRERHPEVRRELATELGLEPATPVASLND